MRLHIESLERLSRSDQLAVARLLGGIFGERDDQVELLERWIEDQHRSVLVALDRDSDEVVGVMIVLIKPTSELDSYKDTFSISLADEYPGALAGLFQAIAVASSHRKQRIATALAHRQVQWLVDQGARVGVGVSWVHGGFAGMGSSAVMFEGAGFDLRAADEDFYRRMHAEGGEGCPRCRPDPCSCVARLYVHSDLRRLVEEIG